jgi:hypothetical protein
MHYLHLSRQNIGNSHADLLDQRDRFLLLPSANLRYKSLHLVDSPQAKPRERGLNLIQLTLIAVKDWK